MTAESNEVRSATHKADEFAMPPVVDRATMRDALDALLTREKAHAREGDAIAAARRRLPMVEVDPSVPLRGVDGPIALRDIFAGRRQ